MTSLDHVGIYIKDLERSVKFYKDLFGFEPVNRFDSGESKIAILDIGGGLLELIQRPGSPVSPPSGNWNHMALQVPEFDIVVSKLINMGVELRQVTMANGNRLCFFKDPDGHTIELMEKGFA
jgi:catechol 2,3-dioxygenase-like lactoylglutathione lyase family enzyme